MSSKLAFLRQGSWMIGATTACGVFMFATNIIAQRMETSEFAVFRTLLSAYLMMGFPTTGLQIVFTHQAAMTTSEAERHRLAGAVRAVLLGTFLIWIAAAFAVAMFRDPLLTNLKITTNPVALWITVLLGLSSLWLPILRGLLQGTQHFLGLGGVAIADGLIRFASVALVVMLGGQAAGGMAGALIGQIAALSIAFWLTRDLWQGAKEPFAWRPWFKRVMPLTIAFNSVLLMTCADVIYVRAVFPAEQSEFYIPAQIIGVALLTLVTPLAAVMFPKVAASMKGAQRSDALPLALGVSALMLGIAALACTLLPELPLRILFFSRPEWWKCGTLVPWFAWALLPLILANVLVNNLMARERFAVAPWLALVTVGYGCALYFLRERLLGMEMFAAFKTVLGTLGIFSLLMLCVALVFTRNELKSSPASSPENRS